MYLFNLQIVFIGTLLFLYTKTIKNLASLNINHVLQLVSLLGVWVLLAWLDRQGALFLAVGSG